jgi:hypothetical protein
MTGRPPLRIAQHGKISRTFLGNGVWVARCRYRDTDGVTRIVERRGPADDFDKYGKLAEDALIEALAERRPPTGPDAIGPDTAVMALVDQHIERLAEDGRSIRTLDTYRYDAKMICDPSTARCGAALDAGRAWGHYGPTGQNVAARWPSVGRAE